MPRPPESNGTGPLFPHTWRFRCMVRSAGLQPARVLSAHPDDCSSAFGHAVGQPFADASAEPGQPFPEGCGPFDPAVHHVLVVPGNRKGNGPRQTGYATRACIQAAIIDPRSEEHTSELQ